MTSKKYRMESKSVFSRTWGQKGSKDGQFSDPRAVAVGYDGTIYVADSVNHRIQCFDSNGTFLYKWGQWGYSDGEFIFPTGLALSEVSEAKNVKSLMFKVPELASFPPGVLPICAGYVGIECIYVVEHSNDRIQVFELDGSDNVRFIRKWGSRGSDDGQFNGPWSCAIDHHKLVYVTDSLNHRIQVFDSEGRFIRKWGSHGTGNYQFRYPTGICLSYNKGHISDQNSIFDNDVYETLESGSRINSSESGSSPINSLESGSQMIYIADQFNHRVVCYQVDYLDQRSATRSKFPLTSCGLGEIKFVHQLACTSGLKRPTAVVVDNDVVYVVECTNDCVRKFRKDGTLIKSWGSDGSGDGQFNFPFAIAKGITRGIYGSASVTPVMYVADTFNSRIVKMSV